MELIITKNTKKTGMRLKACGLAVLTITEQRNQAMKHLIWPTGLDYAYFSNVSPCPVPVHSIMRHSESWGEDSVFLRGGSDQPQVSVLIHSSSFRFRARKLKLIFPSLFFNKVLGSSWGLVGYSKWENQADSHCSESNLPVFTQNKLVHKIN